MSRTPYYILGLMAAGCFSLATVLEPRTGNWTQRGKSDSALTALLGEGKTLFATHFFVKADESFHSGYYPSIFDQNQAPKDSRHMTAAEGSPEDEDHERQLDFLGPPHDCLERFGRRFMITQHTHLENGQEREVLPWLKISAALDPHRIDTYTVAAFWLRTRLHKVHEAEEFLREGLRNNPQSYELMFELGLLYSENLHEPQRAHNLWEMSLKAWAKQEASKPEPEWLDLDKILLHLAGKQRDLDGAITVLLRSVPANQDTSAIRAHLADFRARLQTFES